MWPLFCFGFAGFDLRVAEHEANGNGKNTQRR
jgi:hypothetical protein